MDRNRPGRPCTEGRADQQDQRRSSETEQDEDRRPVFGEIWSSRFGQSHLPTDGPVDVYDREGRTPQSRHPTPLPGRRNPTRTVQLNPAVNVTK